MVCVLLSLDPPQEASVFSVLRINDPAQIEAALEGAPELLTQHRGYWSFLKRNPATARAEEAWSELTSLASVDALTRDLDEALHSDARAQMLLDQFYDELARNDDLRCPVEMLQRTEFAQKNIRELFGPALGYLRAHPDLAMRFFKDPRRVKPAPEALYPMLDHMDAHPELLAELLESFQGIVDNPAAHTRVFPWWQALSGFDQASGGAYSRLSAHFMRYPHRFWVWHERNLALAKDAHARTWIRYWHRRVRRCPELDTGYGAYLQFLRKHPETAQQTGQRWNQRFGPPPPWPPKEAPPVLPRLAVKKDEHMVPAKRDLMPTYERPEKQPVRRPDMPARPTRPVRPTRPAKPHIEKLEKD